MTRCLTFIAMLIFMHTALAKSDDLKQLEKYAQGGSKRSIYSLGVRYAHGISVRKDQEKANVLYRRAAEMNYSPAQNNLGWSYRQGLGVNKDPRAAIYWFRLAALQNNALALQNLAEMYEVGEGVEANLAIAKDLYTLCATSRVINQNVGRESGFDNAILECRRELGTLELQHAGDDQEKLKLAAFWLTVALVNNKDVKDDDEIGVRARRSARQTLELQESILGRLNQNSRAWLKDIRANWEELRDFIQDKTPFPLLALEIETSPE